jgi:hypothetical protein
MRGRVAIGAVGVCVLLVSGVVLARRNPDAIGIAVESVVRRARGGYTVADRLASFGEAARARLSPGFAAAGVDYPPFETAWLAFKDRRMLEVWARAPDSSWRKIRESPIRGASGHAGPKLREGDLQVPEGIYRVEALNPNSLYHVSLRLDYPNEFDRRAAALDGRTGLGGDIMIHGKSVSVGCLAMGDEAAEDLFTLASEIGIEHVTVIIAPTDFRVTVPGSSVAGPAWIRPLYDEIARRLGEFTR